ncbi:MAG: FAD-dependent oxidoreductase [Nostocales cyanobacterium]|nr:MAG: FAD-dependent oxidoreductase [Nostocales cyanobacterium]TAF16366.1 MAG: FAD-dependent oxidoreductase [Nostocales cyanobacterium]
MSNSHLVEVIVIGAGISGLVCAQRLRQAGYSVLVLEKSRGVGGRVATRRLHDTCADHGACYLKPKGEQLTKFMDILRDQQIIQLWTDTVYQHQPITGLITQSSANCYIAPEGMNAIAKFLGQQLNLQIAQRVIKINLSQENTWCLTTENNEQFHTQALIVAIPAPQAQELLVPLGENLLGTEFISHLQSVEFDPCISVMAGYPSHSQPLPTWKALTFHDHPQLGWIGLDSSKRQQPQQPQSQKPHFVVQSSADFAQQHLETQDLQPVGQQMLKQAAKHLKLSWLENPEWATVHRWRYAFPRTPLDIACLPAQTPLPLVCTGDWCGGRLIEGAFLSGLAAAQELDQKMGNQLSTTKDFLDFVSTFSANIRRRGIDSFQREKLS